MAIQSRNKPSPEFSQASIADLVFLLLIYFLLTSTFVTQVGIKVDLPTATSDKPSEGGNTVTITADGQYAWNQDLVSDREQLRPLIEAALQDANTENDVVTLRADKAVIMDDAAFVLSIVAENEGKIVIMTTKN